MAVNAFCAWNRTAVTAISRGWWTGPWIVNRALHGEQLVAMPENIGIIGIFRTSPHIW